MVLPQAPYHTGTAGIRLILHEVIDSLRAHSDLKAMVLMLVLLGIWEDHVKCDAAREDGCRMAGDHNARFAALELWAL